jgi:Calcineurin-like phosphoesterase
MLTQNIQHHAIELFFFQDIDYILWTGDLPPHDVWNQTKDENLSIIKQTVDQLGQTFPNIPIFPALGNHESVPVNRYALELHFQMTM